MTAVTPGDAKRRAAVKVKTSRGEAFGRLVYCPTTERPRSKVRKPGSKARVQVEGGAFVSVPVEDVTLVEPTPARRRVAIFVHPNDFDRLDQLEISTTLQGASIEIVEVTFGKNPEVAPGFFALRHGDDVRVSKMPGWWRT